MDPVRDGDPRQIGPYRLIGHLGSGGMGRVFLGRSRGGRAVAVKVVHAELAGDAEFRRRFADEVGAARRVGGFYTAQVVDADTDADPPWLATAYIPGPSLAEAVTTHGPLPTTAVRVLGAGLAEGLAAIHSSGLVHRDLTHRNVILADDGPRVIDFGIAKALDTVHPSTRIIGTPGFMSPEQARAGQIGPENDVFSLGCVLAYAATGTEPAGTEPIGTVTGGTVTGDRASRDAGEADPPAQAQAPGELERPAAGTASAAMVIALLCLLTVPIMSFATFQAIDVGRLTSGEAMMYVTTCVVGAVVLATGALLLFLRNTAGRWLIATGGAGMTLQYIVLLGLAPLFFATLTAASAAAVALLAVLPSTGRWCHGRS